VADAYCGSGQHVGAENDGAGLSWVCVPDTSRGSAPSGSAIQSGGNIGAGLQGAAAGLEGLAALLSIANQLGSRIEATDATGSAILDPEKAGIRSRAENRKAIEAMQQGRFAVAAYLFNQAALDALASDALEDYSKNIRNAEFANAESALKEGYILEQEGNLAAASNSYMQGKTAAQEAGATDLAEQLAAYNDRLVARAGGARNGVNATQTTCSTINGRTICR
jgi:hypothetical protein